MVAESFRSFDDLKYWHYNQPGAQVLREIKSFYAAVCRGDVPGCIPFASYGKRISAAQTTPYSLWPGPTARQPYHSTGEALTVQSTSPNDTALGSGMQRVEIHYITTAGASAAWETDLNGVTPIPLPENARFIQCLHAMKGTYAAGIITIENSIGTVYSIIPAGSIRCSSAMRFIPVGYRFFMMEITGGSGSGSAGSVTDMALVSTELDTHGVIDEGIYIPHNGIVVQDDSIGFPMAGVFPVSGGQIVGIEFTTDKGATITASYDGWLERVA